MLCDECVDICLFLQSAVIFSRCLQFCDSFHYVCVNILHFTNAALRTKQYFGPDTGYPLYCASARLSCVSAGNSSCSKRRHILTHFIQNKPLQFDWAFTQTVNFNIHSLSLDLGIRQFLGALYEVTEERITRPSVAEYQTIVFQIGIKSCIRIPMKFRPASVNFVQVSSVTATLCLARST